MVTAAVTDIRRRRIRDIQVGRFKIILDRVGREYSQMPGGRSKRASVEALGRATYSNGRGERTQTDPGDLNVPLALSCELIGGDRWDHVTADRDLDGGLWPNPMVGVSEVA
jgi:hypothetical protein